MGFVSNSSTSSFIIIGYNIPMENVMRSYEGFVDIRTEFPAIYHFMNRHKDITSDMNYQCNTMNI